MKVMIDQKCVLRSICLRGCAIGLAACLLGPVQAEEKRKHVGGEILLKILGALADKDRPEWDQEKAEKMLEGILEMENKKDFRWRKIQWDPFLS
ncbi:MAG: hypothetical protein ACON4R_08130 [Akkermansiaceae bacterium]